MKRIHTALLVAVTVLLIGSLGISYAFQEQDQNESPFPLTRTLVKGQKMEMMPEEKPDPALGIYLGLGEAAGEGDRLSVELSFPCFVNNQGDPVKVNLYLMVQLPNGYLYFLEPDGHFSPGVKAWRKSLDKAVHQVVIPPFPLVNPITGKETLTPGEYVFTTLVVTSEIDEDLYNLDWDNDLLDLCFYSLEIQPYWYKQ